MLIFCIPPSFAAFSNSQVIPQLPACLPPPTLRYLRGQHGLRLQWALREYWLNPTAPSFPFLLSPSALPAFATGLASEQRLCFHLIPTSGVAKPGTNAGLQDMRSYLVGEQETSSSPPSLPYTRQSTGTRLPNSRRLLGERRKFHDAPSESRWLKCLESPIHG